MSLLKSGALAGWVDAALTAKTCGKSIGGRAGRHRGGVVDAELAPAARSGAARTRTNCALLGSVPEVRARLARRRRVRAEPRGGAPRRLRLRSAMTRRAAGARGSARSCARPRQPRHELGRLELDERRLAEKLGEAASARPRTRGSRAAARDAGRARRARARRARRPRRSEIHCAGLLARRRLFASVPINLSSATQPVASSCVVSAWTGVSRSRCRASARTSAASPRTAAAARPRSSASARPGSGRRPRGRRRTRRSSGVSTSQWPGWKRGQRGWKTHAGGG